MEFEMEKTYEPQKAEDKWYAFWLEHNLFSSRPDPDKKSFTIVIPPPNVTGSLHMGHALNNTMQDIIIRFHRMRGYNTLWVPGTDHGGIATQNVVEKLLKAEGRSRHDLGREAFLERMWEWRRQTGDTILMQLRRLGCSLDWSRTRFTMDENCSRAVRTAFVKLYEKGLIYRGKRLVNWCPRCHTALADIEVEHAEEAGKLWHIKYPLAAKAASGADHIIVATTRPETMLGDTAVAVHPDDKRYADIVGCGIRLPLTGRTIPMIADYVIDQTFGTGAVKVTPAHDPTDFEIGIRHDLPRVEVIDFHGKMTVEAGPYAGMDRYAARKKILEDLEAQGLLLETAEHPHAVGHCYRCDTVIEPLLSEQWFLKVEEMSGRARVAAEQGNINFYPESWKKPYVLWLENLRDWCISRQIWWGHRIPVYYCENREATQCPPVVSVEPPASCPHCGGRLRQDEDVLDTWFSSALWPFSVFGWSDKQSAESKAEVEYYYPTSVLVTGHEILYLWVARMAQMGLEFLDDVPFRDVYIHGIVRDKHGKKMSKSLGNVIDPLIVMKQYGTDALRFALTHAAAPGRDMQLSDDSFVAGRNFANKIWNASRFILMNAEGAALDAAALEKAQPRELCDRWILAEYHKTIVDVTRAYETYNMDAAARIVYDFFWAKYCDWYIELAKSRMSGTDAAARAETLAILIRILAGVLRLLHPVMPFVTEEIWQTVAKRIPGLSRSSSILTEPWPETAAVADAERAANEMRAVQETVTAIRTIRSEMNVPPGKNIAAVMNTADEALRSVIEANRTYIMSLARLEKLETGSAMARPPQSAMTVAAGIEIFIPLAGLIDLEKEKQRIAKDIAAAQGEQDRCNAKLGNESFVKRAPQGEVDKIRERLKQADIKIERLQDSLKYL